MSRFAFYKTVSTPDDNEIEDLKDYGFFDWEVNGVVGYDDALQTYFANLDGSWGIGTSFREVPTIAAFQRKLSEIFQGTQLLFIKRGLLQLTQGVELNPVFLTPAQAVLSQG